MARGHIEQLKSGRFRVAVYAGRDPITGKKIYLKETHRDEATAAAARSRLLAQVEAEAHPDRAATVAVLLGRWMEVVDHELSTRETTAGYVRRTINPALGDLTLRKLQHRVDLLDRFYTHVRRCNVLCDSQPFIEHKRAEAHRCDVVGCRQHVCKPMSPAAIRRIHAIISAALGYAVSWGWMERNPAEYAHPPKLNRRRARPPQPEQVARLLNLAFETDVELAMFLWLAVTLGARRGELVALRWTAVELDAALIRIEANYVVRAGEQQLKVTKTDTERRLSLDTLTVQMLTDFRTQRDAALAPAGLELDDDAFVFTPDPAGRRPWHPDHFTHAYRKLAAALEIQEPLKNLRHFNATQLLASGVDLRTTAGRLGHSDGGATTLKVYADWMPATDRRAAERLSADLAALRASSVDGDLGKPSGGASRAATPPLRRVSRPVREYLPPPVDGRTTYVEVAEYLRNAIAAGALCSGDLVPTVSELSVHYGIARSTAQRAVSLLGKEGVLVRTGARWTVSA